MKPLTYKRLGSMGRLANQLWQIASTVGVARAHGRSAVFDPGWVYRPWFSVPDDWFSDEPATDVGRLVTGGRWRVGYMQDPAFFADMADEIRSAFRPSARAAAVLDALPQPGPMDVAVHVRRTDYLSMPDHLPVLPAHWYRRAVGPLSTLLSWKHAHELRLHVYGDDPEWAQANLIPERPYPRGPQWEIRGYGGQGDEPTDWCDLQMMARYRHHILANSSYSWWAAWLSGDDHAVAPDPWYGPKINMPSPALLTWPKVQRAHPRRWNSESQEWIEVYG